MEKIPKLKLPEFNGTYNLDVFTLKIKSMYKIEFESCQLSQNIFDFLRDNPKYLKIFFIFDNLYKKIWVWSSIQLKISSQRLRIPLLWGDKKKIHQLVKKKNPIKIEKLIKSFLKRKLRSNFEKYSVERVFETQHPEKFDLLFQYEISKVNMYKIHYKKSEYVNIYEDNNNNENKIIVKKCKTCGWIMKENRNFCPNCKAKYEEYMND